MDKHAADTGIGHKVKSNFETKLLKSHLIIAAIGAIILIVAVITTFTLRSYALEVSEQAVPISEAAAQVLTGVQHSQLIMRDIVAHGNHDFKVKRNAVWTEEITPAITQLKTFDNIQAKQRLSLTKITEQLDKLEEWQWAIEDIATLPGREPVRMLFERHARSLPNFILSSISELIDDNAVNLGDKKRFEWFLAMIRFRNYFSQAEIQLRSFIDSGDSLTIANFQTNQKLAANSFIEVMSFRQQLPQPQQDRLDWLANRFTLYQNLIDDVVRARLGHDWNPAYFWLDTEADPLGKKLMDSLAKLSQQQNDYMDKTTESLTWVAQLALWILFILFVAMAIIAFWVSNRSALRFTQPVIALLAASKQLSSGRLDQEINIVSDDEFSELGQSLNTMRIFLQKTRILEAQKNKLEQANRDAEKKSIELKKINQYKSEFLANMSHELRTPLNSLLILSNILSCNEHGHLDPTEVECASIIHSSGSNLLKLINEILDLSKVESGKMQLDKDEFSVQSIADHLTTMFKHVADDKDLNFNIEIAEGLSDTLNTDQQKLHQILNNLLSNALKFTKTGSVSLTICQPNTLDESLNAEFCVEDLIAISVQDSGIGIAQDQLEAVFEAFKQADGSSSREYGGTGLGLTLSKRFAELLEGNIVVESQVGEGSKFTLYIPKNINHNHKSLSHCSEPDTNNTLPASETIKTLDIELSTDAESNTETPEIILNEEKYTLLIVEDDPIFSTLLSDFAEKRNFQSIVAKDGDLALKLAKQYQPDAILLDISLPKLNGWEVMLRLKEDHQLRHIPVHFLTGDDQKLEALELGAIGFKTKPADHAHLNNIFSVFEQFLTQNIKRVLLFQLSKGHDGNLSSDDIIKLIHSPDNSIQYVDNATAALDCLRQSDQECVILSCDSDEQALADFIGLLQGLKKTLPPIVVYCPKIIDKQVRQRLVEFSLSHVLILVSCKERILSEVSLFLHQAENRLSIEQKDIIHRAFDTDLLLLDKHILIVEDDIRSAFSLTTLLESKGVRVTVAENGKVALDKLAQYDDISLVIMDVMMPVMDGYQATAAIKKQEKYQALPVIALTANLSVNSKKQSLIEGASAYLSKPVETEKLFSVLRKHLL